MAIAVNRTVAAEDRPRLSAQCESILALLRLKARTNRELSSISLKYTSRVSDLRAAGYDVRCDRIGDGLTQYRLVGEPNGNDDTRKDAAPTDDALGASALLDTGGATGMRRDDAVSVAGAEKAARSAGAAREGGGDSGPGDRVRDGDGLSDYAAFVARKAQLDGDFGFDPLWMPDFLFDFQRALVEWALHKGRAAIFADCGLGKTPMQLVFGENVVRKTNGRVLILTPLAVASQTIREAEKFGIECRRASDSIGASGIYVTNYERLHHLNAADFVGVICDESSILKSFDGVTRATVTDFMRKTPYRLLCTATAAPNDFVELGTSSEALGYLGHMDMLNRFFVNDRNNSHTGRAWATMGGGQAQWRFRGHAEKPFWRWVCSWARSLRRPSDLGFSDADFVLPPLNEREHVVVAATPRPGSLFNLPAVGLAEEREERRRTIRQRCEKVAALLDTGKSAVAWCHLNDEGDLLEELIAGAMQVSGKDSDDAKEEKFDAFARGDIRVLVTKPVIGAWGLNWQHCAHMTSFASHSFEQLYQSIRRFWRFGQKNPVTVDHVLSDGEASIIANLRRKSEQADKLFSELTGHMRDELAIARPSLDFNEKEKVPAWL